MDRRVLAVIVGVVGVLAGLGVTLAVTGGDDDKVETAESASTSTTSTSTSTSTSTTSTSTTVPPTTTTVAPTTATSTTTTTTLPPTTTTTAPPATTTTAASATTTTKPSTSTTKPTDEGGRQAAILTSRILKSIGPSNRGVSDATRVTTVYTPGDKVVVTWAVNKGTGPVPSGKPTCPAPGSPTTTSASSSTTSTSTTSTTTTTTSSTTTTTAPASTTTTSKVDPSQLSTKDLARYEAKLILTTVRSRLAFLDFSELEIVGTYPITGGPEVVVADVTYSRKGVKSSPSYDFHTVFTAPPAQRVDCLDPTFK